MKRNEAYPSKYLKAADFPDDWEQEVVIELARMEDFENDKKKLVVYFRKMKSGLVVGPTLFDQIAEITGKDDSDDWKGARVVLFRDKTHFQGKTVACIRVRAAASKKPGKREPNDDLDDSNFR